jgi:pSer/pThr/pTyr-binding forkhead associated (FHA) protein
VRGREEWLEVFQLLADTEDVTSMIRVAFSEDRSPGRLQVWFGPQQFVVTPEHSTLSIGRHRENDVMIDDARVSRRHATIRLRHGKFVLRDESTNGTLVMTEDGRSIALHREDLTLQGSGRLGVTPEAGSDAELPIGFRLEP